MVSLALSTLRARWALFAGTFLALALGVALIAATGQVLDATRSRSQPGGPGRYDAAAVVVRAGQSFAVGFGSGDAAYDERRTATSPHRLGDARRIADAVRAVPGVRRAVIDRSLPARVVTGHAVGPSAPSAPSGPSAPSDSSDSSTPTGSSDRPVGHGWSSAALTPFRLTRGHPPAGDGEVVLAAAPAERAGAAVGDEVAVVTPRGRQRMTVVGIAAPPGTDGVPGEATVFFADDTAQRLSADPDRADAVAVLAAPGTSATALAGRIHAALPDPSLTAAAGPAKGGHPAAASRTAALGDVATLLAVMAVIAGFVAVFVVSGTFAFAIARRRRELALLRTVGATPRQVRRMIMAESGLLGAVASATGCGLGIFGGRLLAAVLSSFGMAPEDFEVPVSPAVLLISFFAGLGVALLGVFAASRRAAKVRPAESLRDAAVETRVMTTGRWITGSLFLAVAVLLLIMLPQAGSDGAVVISLVLTEILVVAMVAFAPLLVPPLARAAALPSAALTRVTGALAGDHVRAAVRTTASAAAPILVTVAVAGSLIGVTRASAAITVADDRAHLTADVVVAAPDGGTGAGAGLPAAALRELSAVPGVRTVSPADGTSGFLVGSRYVMSSGIGAVDPARLSGVLRLDVVRGSLGALRGDAVAVTKPVAGQLGWKAGDDVEVYLADATKVRVTVAAVIGSSAGLPAVLFPRDALARHAPGTMAGTAYLSLAPGADRAAVTAAAGKVATAYGAAAHDRDDWLAQRASAAHEEGRILVLVLLGMSLLYTGIAIANTLVMAAGERAEAITLLRRLGATRRQVLRTVVWETLTVVAVGGTLGVLAGGVTMLGTSRALSASGEPAAFPVPWQEMGTVLAGCLLVALSAALLPTLLHLRSSADPAGNAGAPGPRDPAPTGAG
ncbi:FtsX-like permease family protein [Streptomyces sp. DSM 41527]|uniref:FtsX-like permease family protein n=1 Tax=Streptomyces mooreae TaxID=3075523 RepID=A0ABU2TIA7_9ACTN|nr:FtsX-like permease family protein [Streptomyces sp. DSM 41527]MDT0460650.1 FtsX-like permease family protein [Streptomyces sp. DSM 41527]